MTFSIASLERNSEMNWGISYSLVERKVGLKIALLA